MSSLSSLFRTPDSISASFNYVDSIQTVHINLSDGFAGRDSILVV